MMANGKTGHWFGRYQLTRRIRVGGMAEVWQAKSYGPRGFEKEVAFKRILPHIAEDEEILNMFIEEAKIAARLEHPNITRIYELGKTPTAYYITMEFIYGEDLGVILKRLKQQNLQAPASMVAAVGLGVARGLAYAHAMTGSDGTPLAIVHRDISPPNVMVSHAGHVKLIDFGIAKMVGLASARATQVGVLKGKSGYMSPEQLEEMKLDGRADQFALGVTLWELLAGQRLFHAPTAVDAFDLIRRCDVPPIQDIRPDVPSELAQAIHRALERDREQRFPGADEFAAALEQSLGPLGAEGMMANLAQWMQSLFPNAGEPALSQEEVRDLFTSAEERGEEVTDPHLVDDATEIFIPDTAQVDVYRTQVEELLRRKKEVMSETGITDDISTSVGVSSSVQQKAASRVSASRFPVVGDWWKDALLLTILVYLAFLAYSRVSVTW